MKMHRLPMGCSPIPLVTGKIIQRVAAMIIAHYPVANHFGNNRGRGHRLAARITFYQRVLAQREGKPLSAVYHHQIRRNMRPVDSPDHGQKSGLENIYRIYLRRGRHPDPINTGALDNHAKKLFPPGGRKSFRIIDSGKGHLRRQHNRSSHYRTSQGTTTGLIDTKDEPVSQPVKTLLKSPGGSGHFWTIQGGCHMDRTRCYLMVLILAALPRKLLI